MSNVDSFNAFELSTTATFLARTLLDGPPSMRFNPPTSPFAPEVCGVGIIDDSKNRGMAPLVLLDAGDNAPPGELVGLAEVDSIRNVLQSVAADKQRQWEKALALHVSTPQVHSGPGDRVRGQKAGTAGAKVHWGQPVPGNQGVLSAGHVIGTQTTATVAGSPANVAFTQTLLQSRTQPRADVAVLELASSVSSTISGVGVPTAQDWLEILVPGGTKQTQVLGKLLWLFFPSQGGTAGEVWLTFPGVTVGGDSGAPAVLSKNPSQVIGHVIGGSGSSADYIQDVQYQLGAIGLQNIGV
jgi:hypothetical protein